MKKKINKFKCYYWQAALDLVKKQILESTLKESNIEDLSTWLLINYSRIPGLLFTTNKFSTALTLTRGVFNFKIYMLLSFLSLCQHFQIISLTHFENF